MLSSGCVDTTLLDPLPLFTTTPATLLPTDCTTKGDETQLFLCADINGTVGDPIMFSYFIPGLDDVDVQLVVYDTRGTIVRTLATGTQPAGTSSVTWDLNDDAGVPVPRGDYRVHFQAAGFSAKEGDVQIF
jgi:hypothetical protein